MNDAAFKGNGNCLRPVAGSQFLHDVFNVDLDGLLGDEQSIANIAVAIASGNLLQDLNLTRGEVFVGIMLGQVCRDRRLECVFFPRGPCEQLRPSPWVACSSGCSLAHLRQVPAGFPRRLRKSSA